MLMHIQFKVTALSHPLCNNSNVLSLQGEVKEVYWKFHEARTQLTKKMANWAPAYHGSREYMVCFAAAGHILRFYAVTRGGHRMKAISPEFDLRMGVDCLKVLLSSFRKLQPCILRHA